MLINLSNHPATKWGNDQKQEAIQHFGDITDLPFPHITPQFDAEQVADLAQQYLQKCLEIVPLETQNLTVHLMGEMTFTATLVQLLQAKGITVIASTTERKMSENPDGTRTYTFEFVRFRKYPQL